LEWIRRNENVPKTYGTLFFDMCEGIQDMELVDALRSLMKLFLEIANGFATENTETIKNKLKDWITSQLFRLCLLICAEKVEIVIYLFQKNHIYLD